MSDPRETGTVLEWELCKLLDIVSTTWKCESRKKIQWWRLLCGDHPGGSSTWPLPITEHCKVVLWSGPIQYCEISYFHLTSKLLNDLYMMLPIKMSQEAKLGLCELSGVSLSQAGVRGEDLIRGLRAALAGAIHSHTAPCTGTITGQRRCSCYLVWFMRKQFS